MKTYSSLKSISTAEWHRIGRMYGWTILKMSQALGCSKHGIQYQLRKHKIDYPRLKAELKMSSEIDLSPIDDFIPEFISLSVLEEIERKAIWGIEEVLPGRCA